MVSAQQRVGPALEIAREALREADPREHPLLQRIQARLLIAAGAQASIWLPLAGAGCVTGIGCLGRSE